MRRRARVPRPHLKDLIPLLRRIATLVPGGHQPPLELNLSFHLETAYELKTSEKRMSCDERGKIR